MKILSLVSGGLGRRDPLETQRLEETDQIPRVTLFERVLGADMLDEEFLTRVPAVRGILYRALPLHPSQILEAFCIKGRYDAVISWSEQSSIPFAAMLKYTGSRVPHFAICYRIMEPKKARLLKRVHTHIDRLFVMSSSQRTFAIDTLGIPTEQIVPLRWFVDQQFWRPLDGEKNMICSSGREWRDYGTLIQAVKDTQIRCHIAAKVSPGKKDAWIEDVERLQPLPPHVTVGRNETLAEVRQWYARSRFVVVPLLASDVEVGSTVLLEAMAMGKAVICSRTVGQSDIIEEGKNGLFVPVKDPRALRDAILYLWEHPEIAEEMGREARRRIERLHTFDGWVNSITEVVESVVTERRRVGR